MVACYPPTGSHYILHVDNPNQDGRVITAIYYLNLHWDALRSGGSLRYYCLMECLFLVLNTCWRFMFSPLEYFLNTDLPLLTSSQSLIALYSSGQIVAIHMRCSLHIEHVTPSQSGISMPMNVKPHYCGTNDRTKSSTIKTTTTAKI